LAKESGAECYFTATLRALDRAIETIRQAVHTQYTLGYYPQASGKPYRHIQVRVLQRGARVQTRQGFRMQDASTYFTETSCAISAERHRLPYESKLHRDGDQLIYQEDFQDPRSGWPFTDSSWYGAGEYHVERTGRNNLRAEGSVYAYGP